MSAIASGTSGSAINAEATRWFLLRALFVSIIALGIFFRFYNLDRKVFWEDEIYTSLHLIGTTEAEVNTAANSFTNAAQLRDVIYPGRSGIHPLGSTIAAIAVEDPSHSPLYYVIGHYWIELFGDSTRTIRLLSAILGVAALPCMYWLCLELFRDTTPALFGTSLLAISPINVIYSQQAREYALWTALTICTCAVFLRALRVGSLRLWIAYAVTLALSLYADPLAGFVAVGNVVYACVFGAENSRTRLLAIAGAVGGFLLFLPWLILVENDLRHVSRIMGGIFTKRQSPLRILRFVGTMFRVNYFDVDKVPGLERLVKATGVVVSLLSVAMVGFASTLAFRARERRQLPFILTLVVFTLAPFTLADLFMSGQRTSCPRYFMPLYIGLDLALVYVAVQLSAAPRVTRRSKFIWQVVAVGIVVSRILSISASAAAQTWWSTYEMQAIRLANMMNESGRPMLISDDYVAWNIALGNYLDPKTQIQVRPRCYLCRTEPASHFDLDPLARVQSYDSVFVLGPSKQLQGQVTAALKRARVEKRYHCVDTTGTCTSLLHLWGG